MDIIEIKEENTGKSKKDLRKIEEVKEMKEKRKNKSRDTNQSSIFKSSKNKN